MEGFTLVAIVVALFSIAIIYKILQPSKKSAPSRSSSSSSSSLPSRVPSSVRASAPTLSECVNVPSNTFQRIIDKYDTLEQVQSALRKSGLESSNLIIGIDYTKSNDFNGEHSFDGYSLHDISRPAMQNPYQRVISIVANTLEPFDEDGLIPVYGFGDITTKDRSVFPFYPDHRKCTGLSEVLTRYNEITPKIRFSGPTSFAPIIHQAIHIVRETNEYHILVIIADGQVTSPITTSEAIVEASNYPLSILVVGVGDGADEWARMKEFDDQLPARKFDNFQFVPFEEVMRSRNPEVSFAITALQEIPDQFKQICALGYLGR